MCLNKPVKIPVGSNGASAYVAYAQDSSGTGFSYTPADTRKYISIVTKKGTISQSDFTTWTQYIGTSGTDGDDGVGISNIYVSDGVTSIGGTVYTVNTVVVLLSSGTFINAGEITLPNLTWNNITLLNSWTAGIGVNVPQYAVSNGFLYLRGTANHSSATSTTLATLAGVGNTDSIITCVSTNSVGAANIPSALLEISSVGTLSCYDSSGLPEGTQILLDSIPPISIR